MFPSVLSEKDVFSYRTIFLLSFSLDGKMAEKRHQFDRGEVLKLTPHAAERATIKKLYPLCRWI